MRIDDMSTILLLGKSSVEVKTGTTLSEEEFDMRRECSYIQV